MDARGWECYVPHRKCPMVFEKATMEHLRRSTTGDPKTVYARSRVITPNLAGNRSCGTVCVCESSEFSGFG